MEVTLINTVTPDRLREINRLVHKAGTEAIRLRIVERFLSEVERRMMRISTLVFDVERVRTALQILKDITIDEDEDVSREAEFRLEQEFKLWRTLIEQRDSQIQTYDYRRFMDATTEPLSDEIFISLALFYRTVKFSPATQSKFDLAVTRLFTGPRTGAIRSPRFSREEMAAKLWNLYRKGGFEPKHSPAVDEAVLRIDGFINEARNFTNVDELIRSGIFDRYRVFKHDLESGFFEPEVVAAAIECNLVFGNAFNTLLKRADGGLNEKLNSDVDLAGVLHDPTPGARGHISDLLSEVFNIDTIE